tara:strand:- start:131 stop:595 length:465 start_codon:yes stop_codon:yes gene_type:complete
MGVDHGKRIKAPLGKPKVIDEIKKKGEKYPPDAPSPKTKPLRKKPALAQTQTQKPKVRDALKKNKQAKESSNKTTITDTQKRGQVRQRYDLFEGRRLPKEPTKKTQNNRKKAQSNTPSTKKQPTKFLPHIMKPLFMYEEKPEFLRNQQKTSGEA